MQGSHWTGRRYPVASQVSQSSSLSSLLGRSELLFYAEPGSCSFLQPSEKPLQTKFYSKGKLVMCKSRMPTKLLPANGFFSQGFVVLLEKRRELALCMAVDKVDIQVDTTHSAASWCPCSILCRRDAHRMCGVPVLFVTIAIFFARRGPFRS